MKNNKVRMILMGALLVASLCLSGCGSSKAQSEETAVVEDSTENTENETSASGAAAVDTTEAKEGKETAEEIKEKIDIEAKVTQDRLVAVFITNNSNTVIDEMEVQVNFKDESGNTIDVGSDGHDMLLPGRTVVSRMEVPDSGFATADIQYQISIGDYPSYENHAEEVDVSTNAGDDCVIVEITNNSNVNLDEVEYDVVLFKGDDVVTICYPQDLYDVLAGSTRTEKVDVYNQQNFNSLVYGTDYDRIEVYLNQAHTFGL